MPTSVYAPRSEASSGKIEAATVPNAAPTMAPSISDGLKTPPPKPLPMDRPVAAIFATIMPKSNQRPNSPFRARSVAS